MKNITFQIVNSCQICVEVCVRDNRNSTTIIFKGKTNDGSKIYVELDVPKGTWKAFLKETFGIEREIDAYIPYVGDQ